LGATSDGLLPAGPGGGKEAGEAGHCKGPAFFTEIWLYRSLVKGLLLLK
jgi:hypothetical protein